MLGTPHVGVNVSRYVLSENLACDLMKLRIEKADGQAQ